MKEDIKYPYIGQRYNLIALFYEAGKGLLIDDALGLSGDSKVGDEVRLYDGTNITREYLTNTYGKVESKEHAEFIVELAKNAGFNCTNKYDSHASFAFYPSGNFSLHKLESVALCSDGMKLITIQLPSKEVEEMKNNGDNLVLGCEELKCDEWLKVGGEVIYNGVVCKVLLCADKSGHIVILKNGDYCNPHKDDVQKPKTPEEELRDELDECISDFQCQYHEREDIEYDRLAEYILSKYNITKKPQ